MGFWTGGSELPSWRDNLLLRVLRERDLQLMRD